MGMSASNLDSSTVHVECHLYAVDVALHHFLGSNVPLFLEEGTGGGRSVPSYSSPLILLSTRLLLFLYHCRCYIVIGGRWEKSIEYVLLYMHVHRHVRVWPKQIHISQIDNFNLNLNLSSPERKVTVPGNKNWIVNHRDKGAPSPQTIIQALMGPCAFLRA